MSTPSSLIIADVFARDGLQTILHEPNLRTPTTDEKVAIIQQLDAAGVPEIEITGFVHPRVIPSLADAEAVAQAVLAIPHRATYRALVPNVRGAERALRVGMPKVHCLIIASETYQHLNANMSVEANVRAIETIAQMAVGTPMTVCVGIGTAFVCPYEGVQSEDHLLRLVDRFVTAGIQEISLADSIGMAWPTLVRQRVRAIRDRWPTVVLGLHLHTLAGLAGANAFTAYEEGVRIFDGSVGGIGGGIAMPIHTTSMSNMATEDLVYLFEACGIATGIDQDALCAVGRHAQALIGTGSSHVTGFGTLDHFTASSRERLAAMRAMPPGDSSRH